MATIINKQSITTSDWADMFVFAQAGTRFINRGNLTTTGTQASPIDITADNVIVQNFGDLTASGADSPTLLAGHRDDPVDGVAIYNYGAILNDAPFVDLNGNEAIDLEEYFPDGIQYHGTNGLIENRGTITVPTRSGAAIGLLASDTTVVNIGEIYANIFGIVVDDFGGGRDRNIITNKGLIEVSGGTFGVGIDVRSNDNNVFNDGEILASGDEYIGILLRGTGNHGENDGTIAVTGASATGVYLFGDGHSFINTGTISATLSSSSASIRFDTVSTSTNTFTNLGAVSGTVIGSWGDETIINRGSIGEVILGAGNDTYVAGKAGRSGPVGLGSGDDLLVLEKDFGIFSVGGFVAGAGSGDVIDVSALGIRSFEELLAHAYPRDPAFDAVLVFGNSSIVLEGAPLNSLTPEDFIFAAGASAALSNSARTSSQWEYDWLMI